ncbi:hypothetical protein B0H17DRAFT_1145220 [Mycena rosella]|uniref:Uncharacterized protein n=1 Tax=Mycena rosella TaxID=1033263 RepID=A0AAD7G207_MYCRO|nr:hypothetical protein B0H17DRAFT_1145220 [Mycena rosella]
MNSLAGDKARKVVACWQRPCSKLKSIQKGKTIPYIIDCRRKTTVVVGCGKDGGDRRTRTPLGPQQQRLRAITAEHPLVMRRNYFSAYVSRAKQEGAETAEVGVGSDEEGARGRDQIAKGNGTLDAVGSLMIFSRVNLHGGEREVLLPRSAVGSLLGCTEGVRPERRGQN